MCSGSLIDNWLKIGTNNKSINEFSSVKRRVLTGAKGLGRLGIDRLCKKMILFTKKENSSTVTQLNVDWRVYEEADKSLSEIEHHIYEEDIPVSTKYGPIFTRLEESGTYIILLGLKDNWDSEFIDALINEARLLVSPYRASNDFEVRLSTHRKNKTETNEINSDDILAASSWKISVSVDKHHRVTGSYYNNEQQEEIKHAPIEWEKWITNQGKKPLFGPLKLDFHYIPRLAANLSKVKLTVRDWKKFMELNRGIRIYRDDFRVRPYGEPTGKGDWLDLGYRKAQSPGGVKQGGWRIGPNQVIGAVIISRQTNSILDDQANREGIVENEAFFQMRAFVLKAIETFEELIHKNANRDEETDLADELQKILVKSQADLSEAMDSLKNTFSKRKKTGKKKKPPAQLLYQRITELERAKKSHEKALNEYYEALARDRKRLEDEKDTLANLASLGILTVSFGHEIRTHSGIALSNSNEMLDIVNDASEFSKALDYEELEEISETVKNSISYIDNFSKLAIENIKPDKRRRRKVNVPSVFEYVFGLMKMSFSKMGLKHEFCYTKISKEEFNVRSFEIDWESIAINLITNSIWALNLKPRDQRLIKVSFERVGGTKLRLSFEDSGCGLEDLQEESIFLPMKSSKRDRTGNVIGTGMGLSIVKTQVNDHMGGNIYAKKESELGGAGFYIEVQQDN